VLCLFHTTGPRDSYLHAQADCSQVNTEEADTELPKILAAARNVGARIFFSSW